MDDSDFRATDTAFNPKNSRPQTRSKSKCFVRDIAATIRKIRFHQKDIEMKKTRDRKRKRNCFDRLRAFFYKARRKRIANPASSISIQLLALFAMLFGRVSEAVPAPSYVPYCPPPLSPTAARRAELSKRLGIPVRYIDIVMTQGHVPNRILFDHIRRGGVQRRDAMIELRKRAPEASLDWLDHIQDFEKWSDLVRCYVPGEEVEQTDVRVLNSTLRWLEQQRCDVPHALGALVELRDLDNDRQIRNH
jgi:hypothetical protein